LSQGGNSENESARLSNINTYKFNAGANIRKISPAAAGALGIDGGGGDDPYNKKKAKLMGATMEYSSSGE